MIKTKKELKEYLEFEKRNYFKKKIGILKCLFLKNTSEKLIIWRYQKRLRKYEYHLNTNHKIKLVIYKYLTLSLGNKYGLHIAPNTFAKGLKIMHLGSILINDKAKIGENCSIHINTAIVAGGIEDGAPVIGDNCIIGIGATILGPISIGDNCAIGAGSVVNKTFGDNITIAGVPARIISNNTSNMWRKKEV